MKQEQFDKMNRELESIMEGGDDIATAVEIVALNADLTVLDDSDDQCRIYRTNDGELVNFWLEGIEVGFDDQTEWYTNRTVCQNCGRKFSITIEQDWMEADDGGDICGECVREAEANIMQPEYPDDPAIS